MDYHAETLEQNDENFGALCYRSCLIKWQVSELTILTVACGYRISKDSRMPIVRKEFICYKEHANEQDSYALAVHRNRSKVQ